jgi:hypothetical protein
MKAPVYNGNLRVEKYPEPTIKDYHWAGDKLLDMQREWYDLTEANIADDEKPYWEIEVGALRQGSKHWGRIDNGTIVEFELVQNKAVII